MEFYKIVFTGKWYSPVVGKLVLMSNAELGFLGYYNDEIGAPPFERFYVGGDGMQQGRFDGRTTIALRGYPNSSLSSQTGGTIYNRKLCPGATTLLQANTRMILMSRPWASQKAQA